MPLCEPPPPRSDKDKRTFALIAKVARALKEQKAYAWFTGLTFQPHYVRMHPDTIRDIASLPLSWGPSTSTCDLLFGTPIVQSTEVQPGRAQIVIEVSAE